jgi:hypothetical protein
MTGDEDSGVGRRGLLRAAAGAAGAALIAPQGAAAAARGDVTLLREAVKLEQRLALAFATAIVPRGLARQSRLFAAHARDRAATLSASLRQRGGHLPPPQARGPRAALRGLLALEEEAAGFYVRALGQLHDTHLVLFMGSALTGHAQELVALREALGRQPLPRAFETGRTSRSVG